MGCYSENTCNELKLQAQKNRDKRCQEQLFGNNSSNCESAQNQYDQAQRLVLKFESIGEERERSRRVSEQARWDEQKRIQDEENQKIQQQITEENRKQEAERVEKRRAQEAECEAGNAEVCFELADFKEWVEGSRKAEAPQFLDKACKLGYQIACAALEEHKQTVAANRTWLQKEARERARDRKEEKRYHTQSSGIRQRNLSNPQDVADLKQAAQVYDKCVSVCSNKANLCIQSIPDYERSKRAENECNHPYNVCQDVCEAALNQEGFCLEKNTVTGKATGSAGVCPH
jgi:hypothetical protein